MSEKERKEGLIDYIVQTLKVAEKPGWDEIWDTFKVTITGFLLIGLIGFLIQLVALYIVGG
ncbi:MAG: protein translocase SEC61 complex subunit gamma [Candidatus Korarchaeum sp.]